MEKTFNLGSAAHVSVQGQCHNWRSTISSRSRSQLKVKYILTNKYFTLCRVRSITPVLMEGFSSNFNDTFTSTRGCAEPMFFPQHILPLLQLYNAQWWGYESLTAIVLVIIKSRWTMDNAGVKSSIWNHSHTPTHNPSLFFSLLLWKFNHN